MGLYHRSLVSQMQRIAVAQDCLGGGGVGFAFMEDQSGQQLERSGAALRGLDDDPFRRPGAVRRRPQRVDHGAAGLVAEMGEQFVEPVGAVDEHTGDAHYTWGRLKWECVTQHTNYNLDVDQIDNYYNIIKIFPAYCVDENCSVLRKPLKKKKIISVLTAMGLDHCSGLLIPIFNKEREVYLRAQLKARLVDK